MARIIIIGSRAQSIAHFRGELIQEMVRLGHEVTACAPENSPAIVTTINGLGAQYQSLHLHRTGMNPFQDIKSLWSFVRLFREVRPDIVLTYTIKPVIYGSIGAVFARVNTISSMITGLGSTFIRDNLWQRLLGVVVDTMYHLGLHQNKVVFFQNPDDMDCFIKMGLVCERNRPTLINGSGVDLDYYMVLPLPKEVSFLMVGRLLRDKGVREYAAAARLIKREHPMIKFRLAGRLDDNFTAIRKEELNGWVQDGIIDYMGTVEDIRTANAEASVCVLPSYREGTPRSVLESMAMGRPVITTDVPGCRQTVQENVNGFLVPPRNVESLATAMQRFINEPSLLPIMGQASRRIAEEKYDVHQVNRVILGKLGLLNGVLT